MTDPLATLSLALTGRYRVERELGAGGMATVYLAEDTKHHRRVAVKTLRPELAASLGAERFMREIEIAASLQHPHILSLHDSGTVDGVLFYVMPFVEGQSLRERLSTAGALPLDEALRILREVVDALAYSHEHGVVHRDIKPENIMISGAHALVMDFGIAKAVSDSNSGSQLTSVGIAMGSPAYMAPEQIMADPAIDHRVDIYAVGVMAYEMLTGQKPFVAQNAQQIIAAHLSQTPEPLTKHRASIPSQLDALVLRCMQKNPADRWQSARELLHALESVVLSGAQTAVTAARSRSKRNRALVFGAVAMVAIVAAGAFWFTKDGRAGTLIGSNVLAANDLVFVSDFQNHTTDSTLAATVTDAVRVDLQQSKLVKVMSQSTMFATMNRMKLAPGSELDAAKLHELAEREGAKAYVTGDVARIGGGYQLTARVVATSGGAEVLTVISKARTESDLIAAVEQLGRQLRSEIGESLRTVSATPALAQVTTSSLAALRLYSTAVRAGNSGDRPRAITLAKQALSIDSTFAGAWNVLYVAYANSGMPEQMNDAISHAYALRERLPETEMLITSARYHSLRGEHVEAEEAYRQLVAQGKQFANYANLLLERRRYAEAEEMSRRAVADAPQSAVTYWNQLEAQLVQRRFVQAESTVASARAAVPTSALRYQMEISMPLARRDFDAAAAMIKSDVGVKLKELTPDIPYACMVLLARGQLREFSACNARRFDMEAMLAMAEYRMTADSVRVRRGYEKFLKLPQDQRPFEAYAYVIALLAELGRTRDAEQLFAEWRARTKGTAPSFQADSAYAVGAIAAAKHQWERAIEAFMIWHKSPMPSSWHFFNRGLAEAAVALEHLGNADSAIVLYEKALSMPAMAGGPAYERLWYGETLEKLGDAYAARGDRNKAAQYYRQFVTTYREADAPISLQVSEVRAKLSKLGTEPTPAATKVGPP